MKFLKKHIPFSSLYWWRPSSTVSCNSCKFHLVVTDFFKGIIDLQNCNSQWCMLQYGNLSCQTEITTSVCSKLYFFVILEQLEGKMIVCSCDKAQENNKINLFSTGISFKVKDFSFKEQPTQTISNHVLDWTISSYNIMSFFMHWQYTLIQCF